LILLFLTFRIILKYLFQKKNQELDGDIIIIYVVYNSKPALSAGNYTYKLFFF